MIASILIAATQIFVGGLLVTGAHEEQPAHIRNIVVGAAPIFAVRHDFGNVQLDAEHVPAGPLNFPSGSYPRALSIGYSSATVRLWTGNRRFAIAAGDALYIQRTSFTFGAGTNERAIRAAGAQFGAFAAAAAGKHSTMLAGVSAAPSMHQRFSQWLSTNTFVPETRFGIGSLVDATLQLENDFTPKRTFVYGVRYLNYSGGDPLAAVRGGFDYTHARTWAAGAFFGWGFGLR